MHGGDYHPYCCGTYMPFASKKNNRTNPIEFDIRLDVVDGDHPFFDGLQCVMAMGTEITFKYPRLAFNMNDQCSLGELQNGL